MSSLDQYDVGYRKPPFHTRFSETNQPVRAKKKRQKLPVTTDLSKHILAALAEPVTITVNGKPKKTTKGAILASQIVNQCITGSMPHKLRVAKLVFEYMKLPSDPPEAVVPEEEQEQQDVFSEEDRRILEIMNGELERETVKSQRSVVESLSALLPATSKCQCGAVAQCSEAVAHLAKLRLDLIETIKDFQERFPEVDITGHGWLSGSALGTLP